MLPTNNLVGPMLTDYYQLTMAYAYWKSGRQDEPAVFDLFFRKNPFGGEFTLFAGLEEVLRMVSNFRFTKSDIEYLKNGVQQTEENLEKQFNRALEDGLIRKTENGYEQYVFTEDESPKWIPVKQPKRNSKVKAPMAHCENEFFTWLKSIDCSKIKIKAFREGSLVFPRLPLIRVEGPIAIAQLLETPILTLINYPCLVATKAARMRLAAGKDKNLMEFGLRRAQGPDGGVSASRYSYIGGFNSTSNVIVGKTFGIPISGTHAHSFVSSFTSLDEVKNTMLKDSKGNEHDIKELALKFRSELGYTSTNEGELAAFISYAMAFPSEFLALADTYDIMKSGIPNFMSVALALNSIGYKPLGIRIDSGDLAYYSKEIRKFFKDIDKKYSNGFSKLLIVASNDIDESTIDSLNNQHHEINSFGIGTHLVTCNGQPALGGVYKLVEFNGQPRIKISQEVGKMTLPGRKTPYRLYGKEGYAILDLMISDDEEPPKKGEKILCRHPLNPEKRVYVIPEKVEPLHYCVWDGKRTISEEPLGKTRDYCLKQLSSLREDHLRTLNPTPYKVSVSDHLYNKMYELRQKETPIETIG